MEALQPLCNRNACAIDREALVVYFKIVINLVIQLIM